MGTEIATTADTALSTTEELTKTIRAARVLDGYLNDVLEEGRTPTLSKEITRADRTILTERHHGLANQLRGCILSIAARERAAAAIASMFRDGWPLYKMDNPKQVVAAYIHALQDFPAWAVESVCGALAKGEVSDANVDYPPAAARVVQLCTAKTAELRAEKERFRRVLSIKDIRGPVVTEEERAAVAEKYKQWKAGQKEEVLTDREKEARAESSRKTIANNERMMLREYKALGMEPVRAKSGLLISPSLVKRMGLTNTPKADMDR